MHRDRPQIHRPWPVACTVAVVFLAAVCAGAGTTGTSALITVQGSSSTTSQGDYIAASAGLGTYYALWVEVPPGTSQLDVDLFDADVGVGGSAEAAANRDRARGSFGTTAVYTLRDPLGTVRSSLTCNASTCADNAWTTLSGGGDYVLDTFATQAYNRNDGTINWSSNWAEVNDDASPTSGLIWIDATAQSLRIRDNNSGGPSTIGRNANLSAAGFTGARLSFQYRTSGNEEPNDRVIVQMRTSSVGWQTLETFSGPLTTWTPRSYDITSYIDTSTQVRFQVANSYRGSNEYFEVDDVQIDDTGSVIPGHWELRIDQSSGGDDINAVGVRAHDGDPAEQAGTELNVYFPSFATTGTNSITLTRNATYHPWLTSGCTCSVNSFDWDSNQEPPAVGNVGLATRSGGSPTPSTINPLSVDDSWQSTSVGGWTSDVNATDYGIWTMTSTIVGYGGGGNYGQIYVAESGASAPPPSSQPEADTYRIYLPTDAGGAPVKPYLEQVLTHVSGPNPPVACSTTRVAVTVRFVNPTPHDIAFSSTDLVVVEVPDNGTTGAPCAGTAKTVFAGNVTTTQGSTSTPSTGGTGTITWNPGTVDAGDTVILAYEVDVTPDNSAERLPVTGTIASGDGTTATYVDETCASASPACTGTQLSNATTSLGPVCELALEEGLLTYTLVSRFEAFASRDGLVVEWETAADAGTQGFELWRLDREESSWVQTHDDLLAPAWGAPSGGIYAFVDPLARADTEQTYLLVEVDVTGRRTEHGPYTVDADPEREDVGFGSSRSRYTTSPRPMSQQLRQRLEQSRREEIDAAQTQDTESTVAVKLAVREDGLYVVGADQLAAHFGLTPAQVHELIDQARLSLSCAGAPIAWLPERQGAGGISFYGQKIDSVYTLDNIYRVEIGDGVVMDTADVGTPPPTGGSQIWVDTTHFEHDLIPALVLGLDPESDFWFWKGLIAGNPTLGSQSFELDLPAVAATGGTAVATVHLQGASDAQVPNDHHARISVNGQWVGDTWWQGLSAHGASFSFDPSWLQEGVNTVEVTAVVDSGVPTNFFFVDAIDLEHPRPYRAVKEELPFHSAHHAVVTVNGFPDSTARIFDLGDPTAPKLATGVSVTLGFGSFSYSLVPDGPDHPYLAVSSTAVKTPHAITPDLQSDLLATPAEHLVVTTPALASAAQDLADLRNGQGLSSVVVMVDDIMDEFNNGVYDPHAIRDFVAAAFATWPVAPRFLVLAGAGTYDYRDLRGYGGNLVPPLLARTPLGLYSTDDLHADLAGGDGIPELAVGRIPALTAAELAGYVSKLAQYEAAPAADEVVLVADAHDAGSGADFTAQIISLSRQLDRTQSVAGLSLDEFELEPLRFQLHDHLADGVAAVTYVGHGSQEQLAGGNKAWILHLDDLPDLPGPATVYVGLTCLMNRFELPTGDDLGSNLVLAPHGGAAAVWSTSSPQYHWIANTLGHRFFRIIREDGAPIGEAVRRAKMEAALVDHRPATLHTFVLVGDPALRVNIAATAGDPPPPGGDE